MERKAKSHSKCNMCCKVETDLLRLLGKTDAISVQARAKLLKGMQEHEKIHLAARQELDDAGLQAVCNPRMMWTIIRAPAPQDASADCAGAPHS